MVPVAGLEPARIAPRDFESRASANFATPACIRNRKRVYYTINSFSAQQEIPERKRLG